MFSPDGGSLAYFQGGQLKKVSAGGGRAPVPLAAVGRSVFGASWSRDNTIVWGQSDGIWRVSGDGGAPERIVEATSSEQFSHPQLLAGGEWLLATSTRAEHRSTVARSLRSGEQKVVVDNAVDARYVEATGHLVYLLPEGGLFASNFDARRLVTTGGAKSVLPDVGRALGTGGGNYAVASNAALVYLAPTDADGRLVWMDRKGNKVGEVGFSGTGLAQPALSSDDAYVAYSAQRGGNSEVMRYNVATTSWNILSTSSADDSRPVWSPSGDRVLFNTLANGRRDIVARRADGSGDVESVVAGLEAWTGDWRSFAGHEYVVFDRGGTTRPVQGLWYQRRPLGSAQWEAPVHFHAGGYVAAQFSPNGRYVAYVVYSSDPGMRVIEVVSFPKPTKKWTISRPGASRVRWSRDGKDLFYVADESLLEVGVSTEGADLAPGPPERLFRWRGLNAGSYDSASFDVSRDGRFIVVEPFNDEAPAIHVVVNWSTELKHSTR